MVYVINKNGNPLMPCKEAKARHLLRDKKAKVVKKIPFTIQLLFDCEENVQPISLGIDAGSKHIGVSATTESKVLYEADVELRTDIVDLISTRREVRRTRRNRKTRYRKARFDNRKREEGWLAPSVRQKIETHLQVVKDVHKILPVSKVTVETASFDIQKIKNPNIQGKEYQQGDQLDFWNTREYVLFRDNHTCQCCKGKSGDKILNVHHIESRKIGGDAPNNLATLCETCHSGYHKGTVKLPKPIKRGVSFKDTTFMGIMRWAFYDELKKNYSDVHMTFGYITKDIRIKNGLPKDHYIDSRCISGNFLAKTNGIVYYQKKIRRHNRKIYKDKILKEGVVKRNQCSYVIFGFHRYDLVKLDDRLCYVNSLRTSGKFQIKDLVNKDFKKELSYKKINKVQNRNGDVSSEYWYSNKGVIRGSNHWGQGVATCDWALDSIAYGSLGEVDILDDEEYGFCKWKDFIFKPYLAKTDDTDEYYLITVSNSNGKTDKVRIGDKIYRLITFSSNNLSKDNRLYLLNDPNKTTTDRYGHVFVGYELDIFTYLLNHGWSVKDLIDAIKEFAENNGYPNSDELLVQDLRKLQDYGGIRISVPVFSNDEWNKWREFPDKVIAYLNKFYQAE